jgi:CspA family cold shock protein
LPDVFLHTKRLAAAGHRVIFEGSRVRCRAFRRGAGFFASEILNVDHSKAVEPRQGALHWHHSVTPESNWERVKVKWFDHRRGFGFVTRAADQPDCFFHIETLRQAALASYPMPGDVLEVRYGTGPKGRVVTQMRSMPAQTVQAAE